MATYTELFDLRTNSDFRNKITVAAVIKAQKLIDGAVPTAAQITWANECLQAPGSKSESLFLYVIGKNNAATTAQILAASDSTIQSQVDAAVDALIG